MLLYGLWDVNFLTVICLIGGTSCQNKVCVFGLQRFNAIYFGWLFLRGNGWLYVFIKLGRSRVFRLVFFNGVLCFASSKFLSNDR